MVKVGDFVRCPSGIGCPPVFGFVRGEGVVSKLKLSVWLVQTAPGRKPDAYPKEVVRLFQGEDGV